MRSNLVDIGVLVKHETPGAWLVDAGTGKDVWLPKSLVEVTDSVLRDVTRICTMPEWLAKREGLI